ncbi:SDR family NAD(P)-dependent oxidoreductase [Microbacterium sp. NPDC055665]
MPQRTIVITGASDGIGAAAAHTFAEQGDRLLLVGRRADKLTAVARPLGAETFIADFEKLDDVRRLADQLRAATDQIDVLANNAGGLFATYVMTQDGNERTMQVNHYAPFLLTNLLMDVLTTSNATVVNTSSVGHSMAKLDLEDLDYQHSNYATMRAYGNSKLANILFTKGLHKRFHDQGLNAVAFHPGNISSNFAKEEGSAWMKLIYNTPLAKMLSTPQYGADNLAWLANGTPGVTWTSGEYYTDKRTPLKRPTSQSVDADLADAFWTESARRVGLAQA